jgi:hypothetical protein
MRVMDLPHWPPDTGGAFDARNHRFAISSEDVVIERVTRISDRRITFVCSFEGRAHTYDFATPDARTAQKLKNILENNVGLTLFSVGTIEIPPEPS